MGQPAKDGILTPKGISQGTFERYCRENVPAPAYRRTK